MCWKTIGLLTTFHFYLKYLKKSYQRISLFIKTENNLEVPLQSAYQEYHSTETALLKVHNDILHALDDGECVFLVLLDLSVAFDTQKAFLGLTRTLVIGNRLWQYVVLNRKKTLSNMVCHKDQFLTPCIHRAAI